MPLTPFHLGPALLIGEVFEKKINLISILLAGILIDVRAFFCFLFGCAGKLHGLLHTFIGATLIALFISIIVWHFKKPLKKFTGNLQIKNNYSLSSIILGSLAGAWLHIILDSFMHFDIVPFWPIESNFLLGIISNQINYLICTIALIIGMGIYICKINK